MIKKRLTGACVDYGILAVILFASGYGYFRLFDAETVSQQMAPFVLICAIVCPVDVLIRLVTAPEAYGDPGVYAGLLAVMFAVEIVWFCVQEWCTGGLTVGRCAAGLRLCRKDGSSVRIGTVAARNCLKALARYACFLPMLMAFCTAGTRTLYDLICGTGVTE